MKTPISLSLNPTYYCNLRCDFCYLTPAQLGDRTRLPLDILEQRLDELLQFHTIEHVDLYGGEVLLLPVRYLQDLKGVLQERGVKSIGIITNGTVYNEILEDEDFHITFSYDFLARQKHEATFSTMLIMPREYSVLVLASRKFLDQFDLEEFVQTFNMLNQLITVEIKPYSQNQSNAHDVSYVEFEDLVQSILDHPDRRFELENERLIEQAVTGERNAFSDDHVYITPAGKFAVLEFDKDDREFFLELEDISAYYDWCNQEKERVTANPFCSSCQFDGRCLSEHLRDVKSLDQSCNGFRGLLLKWVENESS